MGPTFAHLNSDLYSPNAQEVVRFRHGVVSFQADNVAGYCVLGCGNHQMALFKIPLASQGKYSATVFQFRSHGRGGDNDDALDVRVPFDQLMNKPLFLFRDERVLRVQEDHELR